MNKVMCSMCRKPSTHRGQLDFGGAKVPYSYCEAHWLQYIVKTGLLKRVCEHQQAKGGFEYTNGLTLFYSR